MATIKSYTDIEQSKKLAQILPLETADMYYPWYIEDDGDTIESGHRINTPDIGNFITHKVNKMILPCWSLSALLGAVDFSTINLHYDKARMDWVASATIHDSTKHCTKYESARALNPVDACVGIIMRLHELKWI